MLPLLSRLASRTGATAALIPLLAAGFAQALPAQSNDAAIASATQRFTVEAVGYRRQIHQNPELSNREEKTAALVAEHLRRLGLEVRTGIARTGVVGVLRGGKPGPVIAVRADMDALPITEETPLPFKSVAKGEYLGREVGVSHACGHDLHVAIQLGVASILASMKDKLPGTVIFVFQPAEEGPPPGEEGGAPLMLKENLFGQDKPEAMFALHANGDPPEEEGDYERTGLVAYRPGPTYASSTRWNARIIGRGAHGAAPHLGVDPVVTASEVVLALQTIRSRKLSPLSVNVVTVGILRGGQRHNVIPPDMELAGTIRTFDMAELDSIKARMHEIFDGVTKAHRASFELTYGESNPVTVNDTSLTARVVPSLERALGKANVRVVPVETGAEDFAYFAQQIPSFYFKLGAVNPGNVSGGHHTSTFRADDEAIPVGMKAMTTVLLDYLSAPRRTPGR